MRRLIATLALCATLAACSNGGHPYPSLDRRPQERMTGSGTPVAGPTAQPSPIATAPSADLASRLAGLREQALKAHRLFGDRRTSAARAVAAASGAAVGSDAWSVAQVALADLESARSQAMIALADLDSLLVTAEIANVDTPTPDLPAVQAVRDEVTGWIADEDDVLRNLRGQVRA